MGREPRVRARERLAVRRALVALAVVAALAIVGAGIGLVLQARDGNGSAVVPQPRASVAVVNAAIRPSVVHFGEPVVADLTVVANKALVDPDTVRVRADFTPYAATGQRRVERTENASAVRFRYRFTLRCLDQECAPETDRKVIELPGAGVFYRFRSAQGQGTAIVDWPAFEVTARVPVESLAPERWRADAATLPAVSFSRSPGTLAAGLVVASALLALLGVWLIWRLLRQEEVEAVDEDEAPEARATPLERALQLAREASLDGDSPERRKAFERVARELGARGLADLADRARALAWSSGTPNAVVVDELEREALAATNGSLA
jgi:hypothetical protein